MFYCQGFLMSDINRIEIAAATKKNIFGHFLKFTEQQSGPML
jgi:hypothetical protein